MWQVEFSSKVQKQLRKLPIDIRDMIAVLTEDIRGKGPVRGDWPNFSKLGKNEYHCHIRKGRPTYVACWRVEDKKIKLARILGTHEKAPY